MCSKCASSCAQMASSSRWSNLSSSVSVKSTEDGAQRRQGHRVRDHPASEIDALEARLRHAARVGERPALRQEFSIGDRSRAQAGAEPLSVVRVPEHEHTGEHSPREPIPRARERHQGRQEREHNPEADDPGHHARVEPEVRPEAPGLVEQHAPQRVRGSDVAGEEDRNGQRKRRPRRKERETDERDEQHRAVAPGVRGEELGQRGIVNQARQPPPGPPGDSAGHQRDQSEQCVGILQACKHGWRHTGVQESASRVPARLPAPSVAEPVGRAPVIEGAGQGWAGAGRVKKEGFDYETVLTADPLRPRIAGVTAA